MDKFILDIPEVEYIICSYLNETLDFFTLKQLCTYYSTIVNDNPIYRDFLLFNSLGDIPKKINKKIILACRRGCFFVVKWLCLKYNYQDIPMYPGSNTPLFYSCVDGHLNIAKWLYRLDPRKKESRYISHIFSNVCAANKLEIAKWLYGLDVQINRSGNDFIFRLSCECGRLDMAQWLLEIDKEINICINKCAAFRSSCENGHLDVAKWLYEINGVDDINVFIFAFSTSCLNDQLVVVKWLYKLSKTIDIDLMSVVDNIIYNEGSDVCSWLDRKRKQIK